VNSYNKKTNSFVFCIFLLLHLPSIKANEYSFGVVPQFGARKLHAIWKPILNELSKKTGHSFKLIGTKTIPSFEYSFQQGEYDFAYMNPWHSLIAFERQGYVPMVRDNSRKLKGILVVRKDSGITRVKELDGQLVAFPSPNALGASLLIRADLKLLHGINIHPVYVDTHSSVYLNVALKQTKAGGGVYRSFNKQEPIIQSLLETLYETRPMSPHPISAHPRVPKVVVLQVIQAFLEMRDSPEKIRLLEQVPMSEPVRARLEDYLPLKEWNLRDFYVGD